MQLTGDIDRREHGAGGMGGSDHREELPTFGSVPAGVPHERRSADLFPEREMYFDMDIALPFHWESMTGKGHKLSKSTDSQEFEFSMSVDPAESVEQKGISPADELFYKGQLLPLHLPKRLQMVQKLSSPKQLEKGNSSSVTVSCFFQPSSLKYSALGMDDSYLGSALVNSRSSSFHSQGSNNFWESDSPGDVDSGDSSSSRDSSGSSQDACVSEKRSQPSFKDHISFSSDCSKERRFFQQRDFFNNHALRSEKSLFSSWLRTPFKWKVFFGMKRSSKNKGDGRVEEPKGVNKLPKSLSDEISSPAAVHLRPARAFSAEQKQAGSKGPLSMMQQGGLFSFPPSEAAVSKDKDHERSASKARESLHKYLNILKPLNLKYPQRDDLADINLRIVDIRTTTFSGNLTASPTHHSQSAGLPSPKVAFAKSMSSPKPSFSEKRSPVMHSLSGNLRVPSFSRSSKASISASNAVAKSASTNNGGLIPSNSPSTVAELHSAIQGAIAHCKQSQAKSDK